MANWIKALLVLAGVCAVIILLDTAGDIFDAALHRLADAVPATQVGTSGSDDFWGVVDNPIRSYIAQHTIGLTDSGSAVYTFWQLTGLFGLIGGLIGSTGARITWTVWGAASIAAVWGATPADDRTIATGFAVLAWTLASTRALRGLSLRPVIHNFPRPPRPSSPRSRSASPPRPPRPPTTPPTTSTRSTSADLRPLCLVLAHPFAVGEDRTDTSGL